MNDLANLNNEPQLQSGLTVEASAITGTKVMNLQGEDLGHVEEVVIDAINGRVAYLVISIGGFMGMGETHYSVPWRALRYDQSLDAYILNVNKTQIENVSAEQLVNESEAPRGSTGTNPVLPGVIGSPPLPA